VPLKSGSSKKVVADNVKELVRSGRKPSQAYAIAMSEKRKSEAAARKRGSRK
jgi:hypothetical protein